MGVLDEKPTEVSYRGGERCGGNRGRDCARSHKNQSALTGLRLVGCLLEHVILNVRPV